MRVRRPPRPGVRCTRRGRRSTRITGRRRWDRWQPVRPRAAALISTRPPTTRRSMSQTMTTAIRFGSQTLIKAAAPSVADPRYLSRILIFTHPGSRIPDPKTAAKEKGETKFLSYRTYLFRSHKFHIIEHYFIFEMLKKKILANFQRIIELFTQKIVTKL